MSATIPNIYLLSLVQLDPDAETPLYRQLYESVRRAILTRQLAPGLRLPSTRDLAQTLSVSRNTVQNAYDQLIAEGYLEARVGSGSYVTTQLPDDLLYVSDHSADEMEAGVGRRNLSVRGARFRQRREHVRGSIQGPPHLTFVMSVPDLAAFPFDIWFRLSTKRQRRSPPHLFAYGSNEGYPPLRRAIADYLTAARGVRCEWEQVLITTGSQEALFLAAQVLLDPGESAWIEEPIYDGALRALRGAGAEVTPVPVDEEGLQVAAGERLAPQARLAYVTPSHQYPLGHTMSLARRMQLLGWADRNDSWILEDDYDSEYRYTGRPLAALQGLDQNGRVIYIGTFSKVLFPAMRLGYLVAPPDLVDAFMGARGMINFHPPFITQATLTDFITEGHFTRHIRRMRRLYAERNAALVEALECRLAGVLTLGPTDAGMHLAAWLPKGVDDQRVSAQAATHQVTARPLSESYLSTPKRTGFLLGFTCATPEQIRSGVERLARAIEEVIG